MNKNELVHAIANESNLKIADAENFLNAFTNVVSNTLAKKENITLVGFGTFQTTERSAREGRNPKTGETIQIAAATVPSFKAGKGLKDAVKAG